MAKTRPPYTPEFRRQMVELVHAGRSPEELAREFEPTAQSIRNWAGQAECDAGRRGNGLTTAEREELISSGQPRLDGEGLGPARRPGWLGALDREIHRAKELNRWRSRDVPGTRRNSMGPWVRAITIDPGDFSSSPYSSTPVGSDSKASCRSGSARVQ
jgi:transposase-like protein